MMRNFAICALAIAGMAAHALPEVRLTASDGAASDCFGCAVALDGDMAVLGAYGDDDMALSSGAAYVFERVGGVWGQTVKLTASDGAASDYFGGAVSISGDRAVVGAYRDDDKGSAYVFERTGGVWGLTTKLVAADGAASDYFGYSVSISGDRIVVGSYGDDDKGSYSGSAYVFERVAGVWGQTAKLTSGDGAASDYFGRVVSIAGDRLVVGAYGNDDDGWSSGSAYVFERSGGVWGQTAKLTASDGAASDYFGCAVSISGDGVVVGAYQDDDNGLDSGSAYVFERVGGVWGQTGKLTAGDGTNSDQFGCAVSISGTNVVVGAQQDGHSGASSGSAYLFQKTGFGWTQKTKLVARDAAAADRFGRAVSVSGVDVLCGAYYASRDGIRYCGAAYLYDVSNAQDSAPVTRDQTVSTLPFGERYLDLDFFDPDGQRMTIRICAPPAIGGLESYEDRHGTREHPGRYFYSWDEPFETDTFTWEVDDGVATSGVATVTMRGSVPDPVVTGADWPQFRGPNRDGISLETGWLTRWPPKELWRTTIGVGFAPSVIVDGRLYTAGCTPDQTHVYCFDAIAGTQIWETVYASPGMSAGLWEGVRGAPCVVGNEVYTHDQYGELYCCDRMTGEVLWHKTVDLGPSSAYGYCASPLVEGDLVILNGCGRGVAVDRNAPHDIVWPSTPEGNAGFPSPVGYTLGSERYIAFTTETAALGVHAASGEVAWSYPIGGYRLGQDPIVYGDKLLFCGRGDVWGWALLDPGPDSVSVVWTNANLRGPDSGTGVLLDHHVYTSGGAAGVLCFDARDGSQKWLQQMPDGYHDGTMIAAGDKLIVYWACKLFVLKASPEGYDEEGRYPIEVLDMSTQGHADGWAHSAPALWRGMIYCRNRDVLVCYQVGPDPPADTNANSMADAWEAEHFGDPPDCLPADDPDRDLFSNYEEYVAGTDPTNRESYLKVSISESNGAVVVSVPTVKAQGVGYEYMTRAYSLERCADLASPVWQGVPGCVDAPADGGWLCFTNTTVSAHKFYRATVELE